MSRKEIFIELTQEQRCDVREGSGKEVSQVNLRIVPGSVILAEAVNRPEALDVRFS